MAIGFLQRKKTGRTRDRPKKQERMPDPLLSIWGQLQNAKARSDLAGSEAIYAAVGRIAHMIACMPLHLYEGNRIALNDDRERLVSYAPNASMTPYQFKLAVETCRLTQGRAYIMMVPRPDGVTVDHLDVLDPQRVQPMRSAEGKETWYRITLDNGRVAVVHGSYVIALYHISTDGTTAISPIDVLHGTLNYDRRVRDVSVSQLEGLKDSIVLNIPTGMSDERRKRYVENFTNAYRESSGHIIVLDSGITSSKLEGNIVDARMLDVDSITKRKVATVYNMPPRMMGDASASGYSTSEQDMTEFLKLTILPVVKQWEEAFNRWMLTYGEFSAGWTYRFDMNALSRGDTAAMAEKHSKAIRAGMMTPNEARAEDGLPPNENGDELMCARDMIPIRVVCEHPELLLAGKLFGDETAT